MSSRSHGELTGAASGLLAVALFVLAFAVFLSTDPTGATPFPSVEDADTAPAYLAANLTSVRLGVLFNTLGLAVFLWFLASLWVVLRRAEGEQARGSTAALVGGTAGGVAMLLALVLTATTGLSTSPGQAEDVATLYTASALLFAFGGGLLSLFLFGVARVIFATKVMNRWLGVLAFAAALLCTLTFVTPFFDSGVLDAATGALGRWAWFAGFVVWLLVASVVLTVAQQRLEQPVAPSRAEPELPRQAATGTPEPGRQADEPGTREEEVPR